MSEHSNALTFESLTPYLLLKNGNFLYKVPYGDGWAVLKVYRGSRGLLGRWQKTMSNWLGGQTGYGIRARLETERACIEMWKAHGIRVFELYPDVQVNAPECRHGEYMLMECVEAPKLVDILQDEAVDIEERFAVYRKFVADWGRRHGLACAEREPKLVHENGDGKHVMILEGELLWFDFEMVYRSRRSVQEHVVHELIQYLWHLHKEVAPELRSRLMDETVANYPFRHLLEMVHPYMYKHPNLIHRFGRAMDRRFKKRARKPTSKYAVARLLQERLAANPA